MGRFTSGIWDSIVLLAQLLRTVLVRSMSIFTDPLHRKAEGDAPNSLRYGI